MKLLDRWKSAAQRLKLETFTLYYAYRNQRTPWYAKAWGAIVVAYAFSPIDLIPAGIAIAIRMIPKAIYDESKALAVQRLGQVKPRNWVMGGIIVAVWIALAAFVGCWILRKLKLL